MSKIHEFWEYQFKFFSCFSKKVEKKMNFFDSVHISKKWRKIKIFYKNHQITLGSYMGENVKLSFLRRISCTIGDFISKNSVCMNLRNMTLNFFHVIRKKLKKKNFITTPTYWKSEEKYKKKDFFLKNYKNHFPINNGWKLKKKLKTNLSVSPL